MGNSAPEIDPSSPPPSTDKPPHFFRRHLVLTSFAALLGTALAAVIAFVFLLNNSLGNIEKVPITIAEGSRPADDKSKATNILMLGTDSGQERNPGTNSILEDAASGTWPSGKYRSDATMLVHFNAEKSKAYVISIPRDSYVPVYDETGTEQNKTKINAALSLYGPSGAISTVENLADVRIDHLAMVDWDGFEAITNHLGGVTVSVNGQPTSLKGDAALAYVRERYSLPGGDFGRVKRQQNFMRAIMSKLVDRGTLLNPVRLKKTADAIGSNLAVDDGWSNGAIRSFALSLRDLRPADITYLTIPTRGTASDPVAGSIVVVDTQRSNQLWKSLRDDDVASFIRTNPELVLGAPASVD